MVNLIYPHHEISRIMTVAMVSPQFRHSLLANSLSAIEAGFGDETFELAKDEAEHLARICATSLAEFAAKIIFT